MVQTNSYQINTYVNRLSLSAYVVIITIIRLLATRRIITQYFILYNFYHQPTQRHYQLSNFAIHGLEHTETDMNS